MYIRNKDEYNFIKTKRVYIGNELGQERNEDEWIDLREMTTKQLLQISKLEGNTEAIYDYFMGILSSLIVKHSIHESETELMSKDAVTDLVYSKNSLTQLVVGEYTEFVTFTQGKKPEEA